MEEAVAEAAEEAVVEMINALEVVIAMINREAIDAQVDALQVLETEVIDVLQVIEKTDVLQKLAIVVQIDQDVLDDVIKPIELL